MALPTKSKNLESIEMSKLLKDKLLTSFFVGLLLTSCQDGSSDTTLSGSSNTNSFNSELEQKWTEMRLQHWKPIQAGCEPLKIAASESAAVKRGLVILLHGFSACPQQYNELAPQLAKAGFDVLAPLFPGHGAIPEQISPRVDDVTLVPKTPTLWHSFARDLNKLAKTYNGEKSIVALSQGSNVALSAFTKEPNLYKRIVAISPKLRAEGSFLTGLFNNNISILNIDEFVLNQRTGWDDCITDSQGNDPRAGFCNFEIKNGFALLDFGSEVVKASKEMEEETNTQIQMILSHGDDGAANNAALEVYNNLKSNKVNIEHCTMPRPVPHSMFSPYDKPKVKPWLGFLFGSVETFLTDGQTVSGSLSDVKACSY